MESKSKSYYRVYCEEQSSIPIFAQPWYLDAVCENSWEVAVAIDKKEKITGFLPYMIKARLAGIKTIGLPPLTPYNYFITVEKASSNLNKAKTEYIAKFYNALKNVNSAIFTRHHFAPEIINGLPLHFAGYSLSHRYTYELSNISAHDEIWNGFQSSVRNHIIKSAPKLKIAKSEDLIAFKGLVIDVFERQSRKVPFSMDLLTSIDNELKNRDKRVILLAKDQNNSVVAGLYLIFDDRKCYCLLTGTKTSTRHLHPLSSLYWEGIKIASERADHFNFLGSMVPNIERMFRSFNGRQIPYISAIKASDMIKIIKGE